MRGKREGKLDLHNSFLKKKGRGEDSRKKRGRGKRVAF